MQSIIIILLVSIDACLWVFQLEKLLCCIVQVTDLATISDGLATIHLHCEMLPNHSFLAFRWIWTEQLGLPATPVNSLALQAAIHAHDITLSSPRLTDDVICSVLFCCHHSQINLGFIYLRFLFPELCRLFSPAKSNLLFLFLSGHGVCPSIFGHADWCRDSKTNLPISWWLSYTNLDLGAPKFLFLFF